MGLVSMLPGITVFGTGGTIAGSAAGSEPAAIYRPGALPIEALVEALVEMLPRLEKIAVIRTEQLLNVGSPDIRSEQLVAMALKIQRELSREETQGVVVAHGTDTIEETAFFLELTVRSDKPVVLVGSMRPATAISADGPMNLLCAIQLAAWPEARRRGVMIVLNDRICPARFALKTNANTIDSFQVAEQGYLGIFCDGRPLFFYPPCRPLNQHYFNLRQAKIETVLPEVDILYGHLGLRAHQFQAAIEKGAKGVVLAGMGAGSWASEAGEEIARTVKMTGFPVVASRRAPWGFVGSGDRYGLGGACIGGGFLDPQKSRIQLQLALACGLGRETIKEIFEADAGGADRVREWTLLPGVVAGCDNGLSFAEDSE